MRTGRVCLLNRGNGIFYFRKRSKHCFIIIKQIFFFYMLLQFNIIRQLSPVPYRQAERR